MNNNQTDNSIINSVKRLERAGDEHSRATEKLINAAEAFLIWLDRELPPDFYGSAKIGTETVYVANRYHEPEHRDLYDGYEIKIDGFGVWRGIPRVNRFQALTLAGYVAGGLLAEIAKALETEASKAEEGAQALTAAIV